jgi:hypothetical protein
VSTRATTRVAFGAPVFNRAEYLEEALESLLAQSYRDFVLVVVDDCSTDATPDIVRRYAIADSRVHYERNPTRVGMVENWRRAYRVAAQRAPGFEYFAFASDHDIWHPTWLESMVRELDADPAAVVAFPLSVPIGEDGARIHFRPRQRWDTAGLDDARQRMDRVAPGRRTANLIYGLFRASALERCGVYKDVVAPDNLLMTQLAALGTFKQVPSELWSRRIWSNQRQRPHQRTRLFVGRPPFHTYLPTGFVHAAVLLHWLVIQGNASPDVGRARGLRITGAYLRRACMYPTLRLRRQTRPRRWVRRQRKRVDKRLKDGKSWLKPRRKAMRRLGHRSSHHARSVAKEIVRSRSKKPG